MTKRSNVRIIGPEDDLLEEYEPIEGVFTPLSKASLIEPGWLIKDFIPYGVVMLGGPPKALKSTLLMAISSAVAGYETTVLPDGMNEVVQSGQVMGFSYEASTGELLHMAEHGLGVEVPDDDKILIADDPWRFQLDEEDGVKKLLFWLKRKRVRLGWIDPFVEAHSLEEKDSRSMIQIIRPLHRWAKDNDCTFIFAHHTKKRQSMEDAGPYTPHDLRGSSALFGKMDGVIMLTPYEDSPGKLTIDAKFKRGKSWRRDIQFAAYGETGEETKTTEVLDDIARMVLGVVVSGVTKRAVIAKSLKISKARCIEAIDACVRVGKLARVGKKLIVCKNHKKKPKIGKTYESKPKSKKKE